MVRRLFKFAIYGLGAVLLLAGLVAGAGFVWLKGSLPRLEGSLTLAGLDSPVEILRDADGIVTIRAQGESDAYRALGFVHAQDRLWQMDFMRRTGAGRLSEVVGARTLGIDRLMRGLDLYAIAEANLATLSPQARAALEAYAAGVNAFIAAPPGPWSPGFQILRYRPEPWRPADSLVWGRLMALQLSGNWAQEVLRLELTKRLPSRAIAFLWPKVPEASPVTIRPRLRALDGGADPSRILPWDWAPKQASNVWVLSGTRSQTGQPILANDPHLSLSAPGLWYLVRIETPDGVLAGATSPGVPFHILGHNGKVAWGFTTTHADTQDLFIERPDPARPGSYLTPDGSRPFLKRKDFIRVRNGEPLRVTFRATRHGPVVNDFEDVDEPVADKPILALAWPGLRPDDRTVEALYRMNRAPTAEAFAAALDDFESPVQNIVYADTDGHMGFRTAGRIPVRKSGDGFAPVPGWTGAFDWRGWIPAADLPSLSDPASGLIVNANNRVVGPDYPFLLTSRWPDPSRAERITQVLTAQAQTHIAASETLQSDDLSLGTRRLLPRLLAAPAEPGLAKAVHRRLAEWDGRLDRDRPEPLIFAAWVAELNERLLAPRLGMLFPAFDRLNLPLIEQILEQQPAWCDDLRTPTDERAAIIRSAPH